MIIVKLSSTCLEFLYDAFVHSYVCSSILLHFLECYINTLIIFILIITHCQASVASTDQVDGSLVEGGGLQDLLHGDSLEFIRVQLLTLIRDAVVHDNRQRAHPCLLVVRTPLLEEDKKTIFGFGPKKFKMKEVRKKPRMNW